MESVSTLVVEWIEIVTLVYRHAEPLVSTLVVEWIEITHMIAICNKKDESPPSWWSGLKCLCQV